MKAIIFCDFVPPQELIDFCNELFGTKFINWNSNDIRFNQKIIEFCEKRLSSLWGEMVYKGEETYNRKCGFYGAGYIREIDTSKNWILDYNNVDAPVVRYIRAIVDKYGQLKIIRSEQNDSKRINK